MKSSVFCNSVGIELSDVINRVSLYFVSLKITHAIMKLNEYS